MEKHAKATRSEPSEELHSTKKNLAKENLSEAFVYKSVLLDYCLDIIYIDIKTRLYIPYCPLTNVLFCYFSSLNSTSMMLSVVDLLALVETFFLAASSVMEPKASLTVAGPNMRIL